MLRGLLSAHGANASLVTVFIDGFFQEPKEVAGLFNIRAVQVGREERSMLVCYSMGNCKNPVLKGALVLFESDT